MPAMPPTIPAPTATISELRSIGIALPSPLRLRSVGVKSKPHWLTNAPTKIEPYNRILNAARKTHRPNSGHLIQPGSLRTVPVRAPLVTVMYERRLVIQCCSRKASSAGMSSSMPSAAPSCRSNNSIIWMNACVANT